MQSVFRSGFSSVIISFDYQNFGIADLRFLPGNSAPDNYFNRLPSHRPVNAAYHSKFKQNSASTNNLLN